MLEIVIKLALHSLAGLEIFNILPFNAATNILSVFTDPMSALKTFRIKAKLAKKGKQNRPIPQWIRLAGCFPLIYSLTCLFNQNEDGQHHSVQCQEETLEEDQAEAVSRSFLHPRWQMEDSEKWSCCFSWSEIKLYC